MAPVKEHVLCNQPVNAAVDETIAQIGIHLLVLAALVWVTHHTAHPESKWTTTRLKAPLQSVHKYCDEPAYIMVVNSITSAKPNVCSK